MEINEIIRDYILSNGLKFNFVAEKSGIPLKTFYRLMNNDKVMSVEEYEKICVNGLSIDTAFFLSKLSQKMRIN